MNKGMKESLDTDTCYEESFLSHVTGQLQDCLDRVIEAFLKETTFELRHQ